MKFLLNGDLNQMGTQELELRRRGFKMGQWDVYPGFESETEYIRALSTIWIASIIGWWNYKEDLIKYKICTEEEYLKKLRKGN